MDTTCLVNGQRQTTTHNYGTPTMWATKPKMTPQKSSRLLMGSEEVTRPKTLHI